MPTLPDVDIGDPNDPTVRHVLRFRQVALNYPLAVTKAYGGDMQAAARDSDVIVAARVRQWEIAHGIEPNDWTAIGREERGDELDYSI